MRTETVAITVERTSVFLILISNKERPRILELKYGWRFSGICNIFHVVAKYGNLVLIVRNNIVYDVIYIIFRFVILT